MHRFVLAPSCLCWLMSFGCGMLVDQPMPETLEQERRIEAVRAFYPASGLLAPDDSNRTFAPYDRRCVAMRTSVAPIDPIDHADEEDYFERPIERRVHQIWFGDRQAMASDKPELWQEMAERFGYQYRLWTEADMDELHAIMPPKNAALLDQFLHNHSYHSASDIARVSLLEAFGGLYVDVDMRPPRKHLELIDPARVIPMRNVVVMSEVNARDSGSRTSLFVANGFMAASAGHPLIRHLVASMPRNVEAMVRHGGADSRARGPAEFMTGPFFVTRSLAGAVTVLPFTYMKTIGIL